MINSDGIVTLYDEYDFSAMEGAHRAAKIKVLGHVGLQKVVPGAIRRVGQLQTQIVTWGPYLLRNLSIEEPQSSVD